MAKGKLALQGCLAGRVSRLQVAASSQADLLGCPGPRP